MVSSGFTGGVAHPLEMVHGVTAFIGTFIGAITLTGSAVAFGKLHGTMSSSAWKIPGKNLINLALLGACATACVLFLRTLDPVVGVLALGATTVAAGVYPSVLPL